MLLHSCRRFHLDLLLAYIRGQVHVTATQIKKLDHKITEPHAVRFKVASGQPTERYAAPQVGTGCAMCLSVDAPHAIMDLWGLREAIHCMFGRVSL